jgi:hypothetical protein
MMKGRNNGKKLLAVRIVAHAFEIIHLLTDQNPIQVRAAFAADIEILFIEEIFFFYRYLSMPSLIRVLAKIPHVSGLKGQSVVKQLMFRHCVESTSRLLS